MALLSSLRFRDRREVRRVLNKGRRIETPLGRVSLLASERAAGRILFVVSTRISKKSVRRHAIKRHLDEWVRLVAHELRGRDIIVMVRPDVGPITRSELLRRADAMVRVLGSFGVLADEPGRVK